MRLMIAEGCMLLATLMTAHMGMCRPVGDDTRDSHTSGESYDRLLPLGDSTSAR